MKVTFKAESPAIFNSHREKKRYGDAVISDEDIIAQLSAKLVKSGVYTSKTDAVEDTARKLGVRIVKIGNEDLKRAKKILSRGEPLSKIVISSRGT